MKIFIEPDIRKQKKKIRIVKPTRQAKSRVTGAKKKFVFTSVTDPNLTTEI